MDWAGMGFGSAADYKEYLRKRAKDLLQQITQNPELLNVFKRLNDK